MRAPSVTTMTAAAFLIFWGTMWFWAEGSSFAEGDGSLAYDPLFYPRVIIVLGAVLAFVVLLYGLWKHVPDDASGQDSRAAFLAMALSAAFLLTLKLLGFFLSSAIFTAAFAFLFGYRRPFRVVTTWALTAGFVWLAFTEGLQAPLPSWPIFIN